MLTKFARCPVFSAPLRKSEELNELQCSACIGRDWSIRTPDERSPKGRTKDFRKVGKRDGHCYWNAKPLKLAGPIWVEAPDADRGYIDKYFSGWVDPAKFKLLDYATLAELLIAYVDDAHAAGDTRALKILDRRAIAD
jgi:hypothetical protein